MVSPRALRNGPAVPVINRFALATGDHVVFTGEMRRERPDWERRAVNAGLRVHPAVTKWVKEKPQDFASAFVLIWQTLNR